MSGNIFDGCVAKDVGLDCNCKYCSFIKFDSYEDFPKDFPANMKNYDALRTLKAIEKISSHEGRLNNQFERLKTAEDTVSKNSKRLDTTEKLADKVDQDANGNIKPKVVELDNKSKAFDTRAKTMEDRLAAIESIKVVERLAALESKLPVTPGTTRN